MKKFSKGERKYCAADARRAIRNGGPYAIEMIAEVWGVSVSTVYRCLRETRKEKRS